jgi:3-hydroxyacyl-CoA dehydrogenase/enoyl-CoA hydratase/3-hydroxybutyryl-CoA epimerase/enoyl-CoA isomerase
VLRRADESVNKFDQLAIQELLQALQHAQDARGLLVTRAKDGFVVGADIFEFRTLFERPEAEIEALVREQSSVFTALSQLPFPTVAAIDGMAFGGGFEAALACDYRVMADGAVVGLPEVTLGVIPGYGGSVRLARIAGGASALQWVTSGVASS